MTTVLSERPGAARSRPFLSITPFKTSFKASVVKPEPDYFAEAGAGEKAPTLGCCYVA